jgi:hypothetical protein
LPVIERRVREDERELELGDGLAEHDEVDRYASLDFGEHFAERRVSV